MQHTLFVKVRHALRNFMNHLQCIDSCGFSIAQTLQVFHEASPGIIFADLLESSQVDNLSI
jgi:hypothetical protein